MKFQIIRVLFSSAVLCGIASAGTFTVPSFENPFFVLGSINGQNGWGFAGNSPTLGNVVTAPSGTPGFLGAQSLELRSSTDGSLYVGPEFVANGLYSWRHQDAAAGEASTGAPSNVWTTSFYYRTPDVFTNPSAGDTLIQFNPSFRPTDGSVADRYAFFGVVLNANNQYDFLLSDYTDPSAGTDIVALSNISAGTWYRLEYTLTLVNGLTQPGNFNNDIFSVRVFDALLGTQLGITATGGTWEAPWQTNSFGGGTGPRVINSMDFLRRTGPVNVSLGFIDNVASLNEIPEPSTVALAASAMLALAVMRRRK